MGTRIDEDEASFNCEPLEREDASEMDDAAAIGVAPEVANEHPPLPWIGSLSNPCFIPILALNDGGYLVPLFTAGDLLRGCRYLWAK